MQRCAYALFLTVCENAGGCGEGGVGCPVNTYGGVSGYETLTVFHRLGTEVL